MSVSQVALSEHPPLVESSTKTRQQTPQSASTTIEAVTTPDELPSWPKGVKEEDRHLIVEESATRVVQPSAAANDGNGETPPPPPPDPPSQTTGAPNTVVPNPADVVVEDEEAESALNEVVGFDDEEEDEVFEEDEEEEQERKFGFLQELTQSDPPVTVGSRMHREPPVIGIGDDEEVLLPTRLHHVQHQHSALLQRLSEMSRAQEEILNEWAMVLHQFRSFHQDVAQLFRAKDRFSYALDTCVYRTRQLSRAVRQAVVEFGEDPYYDQRRQPLWMAAPATITQTQRAEPYSSTRKLAAAKSCSASPRQPPK